MRSFTHRSDELTIFAIRGMLGYATPPGAANVAMAAYIAISTQLRCASKTATGITP